MRVCFTNLGCKLNQAEIEALARGFVAAGHVVVGSVEEADVHVVNSCTVTAAAARGSRKAARRAGRGARTVVTGCWATERGEEAARIAGVDLVVGNGEKERLVERVCAAFPELAPSPGATIMGPASGGGGGELRAVLKLAPEDPAHPPRGLRQLRSVLASPPPPPDAGLPGVAALGRTRALVKIEDGCDMGCSFCIIPKMRGRQRSRAGSEVVGEVRALVAGGAQEVVLTGVQISAYRDGEGGLVALVRRVLGETEVPRLRLTSIAPWDLGEELVGLWPEERLCRHLHLSLQSGSTATLRRMRRPYSAERFAAILQSVRERVQGVAVTTDVIVGFPGETGEEFEESLAFVAASAFAKVHVFPFSARPGTAAESMVDQVPVVVRAERAARMQVMAGEAERRFWRGQVGRRAEVLWERPKGGLARGLTDDHIRVLARLPPEVAAGLRGRFAAVDLREVVEDGVVGELVG